MNKLNTDYNGGFPLTLDDFRWIDEGYREAFRGMLSPYGIASQQTYILSGCAKSIATGTVTIQPGYVSIGGELCRVPLHTYAEPTGGDVDFWTVEITTDPEGSKVFQNSAVNETYQIRTAILTVGSSIPSGSTTYAQSLTIHELILQNLPIDPWQELLSQTVISPTLLPGNYAVEFRKDRSGFVHLSGNYHTGEDPGTGLVDILIQTLPVGYRPTVDKIFHISTINGTAAGSNIIQIGSNGQVRIKVLNADYVNLLDFSQITPFEAV